MFRRCTVVMMVAGIALEWIDLGGNLHHGVEDWMAAVHCKAAVLVGTVHMAVDRAVLGVHMAENIVESQGKVNYTLRFAGGKAGNVVEGESYNIPVAVLVVDVAEAIHAL